MQQTLSEHFGRPLEPRFDTSVAQIAHPAFDPQGNRKFAHEPAKTDALHASADEDVARRVGHVRHRRRELRRAQLGGPKPGSG